MKFKATLSSDERLKSVKRIEYLFEQKKVLFRHPFKVYYSISPLKDSSTWLRMKFGITVPKALIKKAVNRNRIKRVVREAFRLQKAGFLEDHYKQLYLVELFFVYIDKGGSEDRIQESMGKLLKELGELLINQE